MARRGNIKVAEPMSGYKAAKRHRLMRRLEGVIPTGSGADYHYLTEREYFGIMELGREFDRNNPYVGAAVDRVVDNVVQRGFQYAPKSPDKGLNAALKERWADWTNDATQCDIACESTFHDFEEFVFRETLVSGGAFLLPLESGSMQLFEYHRCKTPRTTLNVIHGILRNEFKKPLEYWFTRDEVETLRTVSKVADMVKYPAWDKAGNPNVFHIYNPRRKSQSRGVSACHPVAQQSENFDDLNDANILRAKVLACLTFIEKYQPGHKNPRVQESEDGKRSSLYPDGVAPVEPGMILQADEGVDYTPFAPNVPNAEFFEHALMILQSIAITYKIPVEVLLLDPKRSNLASWRGSFELAKIAFRKLQQWYIRRFHAPICCWKIRQWIAGDSALYRAVGKQEVRLSDLLLFRPPEWDYTEPLKDVTAEMLEIKGGLNSRRRVSAERNNDWEEVATEIVEDNSLIIRRAIEESFRIKKRYRRAADKYGVDINVPWQVLASYALPEGLKINIGGADGGDDSGTEKGNDGGDHAEKS